MYVKQVVNDGGVSMTGLEEKANGSTRMERCFPESGVGREWRWGWPKVFQLGMLVLTPYVIVGLIHLDDLVHEWLKWGVFVIHAPEKGATSGKDVRTRIKVAAVSKKEERNGVARSGGLRSNHRYDDILEMSKS